MSRMEKKKTQMESKKNFLNQVKQHFPKGRDMGSVLSRHNKKILSGKEDQYRCNCRNKAECPLDNNCLTKRIIYQADVLTNLNNSKRFYVCRFGRHIIYMAL